VTELVLASASPRRREILTLLGYSFRVEVSGFDEGSLVHADPALRVRELALGKALEVSRTSAGLVLGADTVVHLDETILEKPTNRTDAVRMLEMLAGRTHEVHTGVSLCRDGVEVAHEVVCTQVTFRKFGRSEIETYLDTGDHIDKAGSYGIQSPGARLVDRIDGCFYNVAGLPVSATLRLLAIGGLA
jgi:septum formation protein